ncbi:hypothetical protein CPB84DRAFT_1854460 [Gymnopilus junonius]|uniref:Uncharacterized protein n=1 Tax=Gymnopilus junonius TaxID=109634 RepID=A0A9P5TF17_GYMJU|nr:hypothetical protein CPB84DRAFT_1854460 [Gymnopilus junonius]
MSVFRPLVHYGLRPLFVAWKNSVGPDVAAKTRVSVIGGLYMQAIGVRATTDIDIVVQSGPDSDRFVILEKILRADNRFTRNTESRCGVTFRESPTSPIVRYDLVDETMASRISLLIPTACD